ncbi:peptidoglycan DD-metalloendopeptidase family protein [Flexivirga sp. ID2601S]|uniref:Peptidoglycan DD-metalloendopeptidase family protein n=1 Tax=Flexivirga aerilata TaxID=1656889 RepID=A0A849AFF5_9MICO|nr:peptidoglycan DD-metalloendopeptidase family protein [Flexivirga aerilata]NNG39159.1 peptidoglycan DD-metalloendopeptidase family protein [Flexivirga aerilata]
MPLYGIDISNNTGDIDLAAVPYDILGLKATEGRGYRDQWMARHSDLNRRTKNADEVYYHFVSTGNTAEQEAANFIETVRDRLRPQDCICLDWEGAGVDNGVEWARRWCQIVEPALGKRPWIYAQQSILGMFAGTDIADNNPLWIANYGRSQTTGGYGDRPSVRWSGEPFRRIVAWQFTDKGHLDGYSGTLDLDEFYVEPGRLIDWAGNVGGGEQPQPVPEVSGRIGERWRELGGPNSPLGNPTGEEIATPRGAWRQFEHGVMIWSPETDAHPNYGAIRERYADYDYEYGRLGFPISDEYQIKEDGRWQEFEHGAIYWSPATGAHAVYGRIRERWGEFGWENGALGYPTSDEFDGSKPGGRVQRFQGGVMYWTPAGDAHPVWGLMFERYTQDGWEGGRWGYPVSDERRTGAGWEQDFEGGRMDIAGGTPPPAPAQYVRPVKDPAKNPIGAKWRQPGRMWKAGHHTGIDIVCPTGTPVYATIGGDVRDRPWGPSYGTFVVINDDVDGSDWGYCHLSRKVVSVGQRVQTGDLIGYSGATGNVSGPHLHLERRPRGGQYGSDLDPNLWP